MSILQVTTEFLEKTFASEYIAAVITCIFNAILLIFVKKSIDKTLETHKISYAGIFKEKIEVHRNLLKYIYPLRQKIQRFGYLANEEMAEELKRDFDNLITFYLINQPFLTLKTIDLLKKLISEYQISFDAFYTDFKIRCSEANSEQSAESTHILIQSMNKFKTDYFQGIEAEIVADMREDLNINPKKK